MSTYTLHALSLSIVPIMIGFWIGVVGMGKAKRDAAWWWMIAGIGLQTAMALFYLFLQFGMANFFGTVDWINEFADGMGTWAMSNLGSLVFAIGFALMGWKAARRSDRITELELMNLAQATELERLRDR
jgi:fumarate reductase subunit D